MRISANREGLIPTGFLNVRVFGCALPRYLWSKESCGYDMLLAQLRLRGLSRHAVTPRYGNEDDLRGSVTVMSSGPVLNLRIRNRYRVTGDRL
jgi:hypothetical protein